MRELLQQALSLLASIPNERSEVRFIRGPTTNALCDLIRKELFRSKWHKVADGLPVVPDGEQRVAVWVCCSNEVLPEMFWSSDGKWWGFEKYGFTHWQYRQDDTPAPPEDL